MQFPDSSLSGFAIHSLWIPTGWRNQSNIDKRMLPPACKWSLKQHRMLVFWASGCKNVNNCACVCFCIHACVNVRMHLSVYIWIYMYACTFIYSFLCVYECMCAYKHVYTCVNILACVCVRERARRKQNKLESRLRLSHILAVSVSPHPHSSTNRQKQERMPCDLTALESLQLLRDVPPGNLIGSPQDGGFYKKSPVSPGRDCCWQVRLERRLLPAATPLLPGTKVGPRALCRGGPGRATGPRSSARNAGARGGSGRAGRGHGGGGRPCLQLRRLPHSWSRRGHRRGAVALALRLSLPRPAAGGLCGGRLA